MAKVVLAYSGGLDTSVAIHWLKTAKDLQVITFAADLGQGQYLEPIGERALEIGARAAHIVDLREQFVSGYIIPAIKASAIYEGGYLLATALGRPLIASELVKLANEYKAEYVAHGCTGKGNDQVRFDASIRALAPHLKIIAPLREWELKSREEEIDYAMRNKIPIDVTHGSPYSLDRNLWGLSIECGVLEDPWVEPPKDVFQLTVDPEEAPDEPTYIEIGFEKGVPVSLDGEKMSTLDLIGRLGKTAGANGVGRSDLVENRLVGIKSREVYEAPAATVIYLAHKALEALTLSKDLAHFKEALSQRYSQLIYDGLWFSETRDALDAFFDRCQQYATGEVRVKLYKGSASVVGRKSPYSLYSESLATYTDKDAFDHTSAKGFIDIWSLPLRIQSQVRRTR
jgi:argininosuccinate synthase